MSKNTTTKHTKTSAKNAIDSASNPSKTTQNSTKSKSALSTSKSTAKSKSADFITDFTQQENNLLMRILVAPQMANFSGVMHGGELLKLFDQVAYACSTRFCGIGTVTMSVDNVAFYQPIPIGSLLSLYASVNFTGKTSCEVGIKAVAQNIKDRSETHCASGYYTMVAKQDGKTALMREFAPKSTEEKRRYANALKRRELRGNLQK
ncbi:acyl-CoA thioesterase [Helicobacter sp. T3_23-1059]